MIKIVIVLDSTIFIFSKSDNKFICQKTVYMTKTISEILLIFFRANDRQHNNKQISIGDQKIFCEEFFF